jgi:hypothetical protein
VAHTMTTTPSPSVTDLPALAKEFLRMTSPLEMRTQWRAERNQARGMLRDCRRPSYLYTVDAGLDVHNVLDWLGEILSEPVDDEPFDADLEYSWRQSDFIAQSELMCPRCAPTAGATEEGR